jgi:AmmeMemoRadiSam system protein B
MGRIALGPRPPIAAGRFYPDDAEALHQEVARLLAAGRSPERDVVALLAPHAGYVYSGGVAGAVFAAARVPDCVVVLGPNHTGLGRRVALRARGAWQLPGLSVPVDEAVCDALVECGAGLVEIDERAHAFEHSVEVELPFLATRNPGLRLVPLALGELELGECEDLGAVLARALPKGALVVASSDLNHYLSDAQTRVRDRLAIDAVLTCDAAALHRTCIREDLSVCGFIPATVMLAYARQRGATRSELVAYATSAEAFGDHERVVGYAGMAVE